MVPHVDDLFVGGKVKARQWFMMKLESVFTLKHVFWLDGSNH